MAKSLTYQVILNFDHQIDDDAGYWQYAGAEVVDNESGEKGQLTATKRLNKQGDFSVPASMLTGTIMFPGKGLVPESLTFQGVHDLASNDELGTVTSASPRFAAYVGGAFAFEAHFSILGIQPPS